MNAELTISLCALGLTLYGAWATRAHNRLSVRPLLDWSATRNRASEGITVLFSLRNSGVGPAIVKDRIFQVDGAPCSTNTGGIVDRVVAQCLSGRTYILRRHSLPGCGTAIQPGQEICIAEIFFPGLKLDGEREVVALFDKVDFRVKYESLYKQKFTFTTGEERG